MLEKLDDIDWKHIQCGGGGSSERIPHLIRNLQSSNVAVCREAIDDLEYYISQQGSAFEVTPLAIPFLLELLESEDGVPCKDAILGLLAWFTGRRDDEWYRQARTITANGLDIYLSLLTHQSENVRSAAIDILWRPDLYPIDRLLDIAQALIQFIEREPVTDSRAFGLLRFGEFVEGHRVHLQSKIEAYGRVLESVWRSGAEYPVPQAAAIALAQVVEASASSALDDFLADLAAHLQIGRVSYGRAIVSLWHLGPDRRVAGLVKAISIAQDTNRARTIAEYLLAGVFRGNPLQHPDGYLANNQNDAGFYKYTPAAEQRTFDKLSSEQRQALKAVVDTDKVWEVPHNLLEAFGLPARRQVVRRWLARDAADDCEC